MKYNQTKKFFVCKSHFSVFSSLRQTIVLNHIKKTYKLAHKQFARVDMQCWNFELY